MGIIYHGSKEHNLKKIEPRKSTHGTFVYATTDKALALHFSKRCGDDLTYSIGHYSQKEGSWELVELVPGALEKMYSNDSSLYTLSDETFEDIHTGFQEVVSKVSVDVIDEEYFANVFNAILKLEEEGKIKIYRYPNKPEGIPKDSSNILDKWRFYKNELGRSFEKHHFDRLLYLHPKLLEKANDLAKELQYDYYYEEKDLIDIFQKRVTLQLQEPEYEQYVECAYQSICEAFPAIADEITQIYNEYISQIDQKKL